MIPKTTSATLLFLVFSSLVPLSAQTLDDPTWWLRSPKRFDMVLLLMKSQQAEHDRRQEELAARTRLRELQLRKKTAELLAAVRQLHDQIGDSEVIHAQTPHLARRCEDLSKQIKKLLRQPR